MNYSVLKKYWSVVQISWQSGFVYRFNFIMWRVRNVVQLLTLYFLWLAVSGPKESIFSYSQAALLTYVLGSSLIRAIVLSVRSIDSQVDIATGDLNNFLIKPLNYFVYWAARDIADKALNIAFAIVELVLLYLILKPPIIFPQHPSTWFLFALSVSLATALFFMFSFIISMTTFWYYQYNGWAQRFLSFVIVESLAGSLFPLDILPPLFAKILISLPTAYFIYFPMQIYLERLGDEEIATGYTVLVFWIIVLYIIGQFLWQKGLKVYAAFGR
ncbi:MAG: ABC-2 family transporter protein [Candidatus Chisholmbacteria bacterium]|nr:ABC-2 family transporter protein [Candidatus Chisholmbacteria bacterium]